MRIHIVGFFGRDILGDIDDHRSRSARGGDIKGFFQGHRQITDVLDQKIVFDARAGDANRINLLKGIIADQCRGHLTGDHHHRYRIHIGCRNTRDRIGGPRA